MNFGEALQALKEGKKVTRSIWEGYWQLAISPIVTYKETNGLSSSNLNNMILAFLRDNQGIAPAQPYQSDLLAEDWMIVE